MKFHWLPRIPLLCGVFCCLALASLTAEEKSEDADPAFGHSVHGEVFNEGPRQAAVLIPGTGDIDFAITTQSKKAQRFFNQGVGQLHGFWDFEAERSFRQVAAIDPDCAMAYWGMAMANLSNEKRSTGFIREAEKRKGMASAREKLYIEALGKYLPAKKDGKAAPDKKKRYRAMTRAWEKIVIKFPDDLDAKAFLLKQIWYNNGKGHPISSHLAADFIGQEIHRKQPNHPAHHYRIHLWDHENPSQALPNAAACGPASPGIAHMWHMPGHIYSGLKRYQDAAWQQEASARIDHSHMSRFQVTPDKIHNFSHNNEWLIRNLNFIGRAKEASDLARNMISLPRLAKFKGDTEEYSHSGGSWSYGRRRLRDTLMHFEQWKQLLEMGRSDYLVAAQDEINRREWHRFMGVAAYESGDVEGGEAHLEWLKEHQAQQREKQKKAVADAGKKNKEAKKSKAQIDKAIAAAKKNFAKELKNYEQAVGDLSIYQHLSASTDEEKQAKQAIALLDKNKGMSKNRKARLYLKAGSKDQAIKLIKTHVRGTQNQTIPLATQVWVLWQSGKKDEARKAFKRLQTVAANADLNLPAFTRLKPIVADQKLSGDWRNKIEPAKDLGKRPPLDSLGPFRWQAPMAKVLTLPKTDGKNVSLSDYKGKAVLVIFFLGRGCTHCMEQLNAFSPMLKDYKKAGIDILAVSTDSLEGLRKTYAWSDKKDQPNNPFPFPLASDKELKVFKQWRAYDDFEKMALHGTFLIDAEGRIRWQDISYEPFMHPKFLLEESKRLLGFGKE
ncbi:MAG: redoxin domain-containing protein [Verrucomicrobiales bacterium]|nr:redoxin domain-containing protein [Verrucomicrobiales bacterium]